jgi:hypothetical protein
LKKSELNSVFLGRKSRCVTRITFLSLQVWRGILKKMRFGHQQTFGFGNPR